MAEASTIDTVVEALTRKFLADHPQAAARRLEELSDEDAAEILADLPPPVLGPVMEALSPAMVEGVLSALPAPVVTALLDSMDRSRAAVLLSRIDEGLLQRFLGPLGEGTARDLQALLQYPPDSAGQLMDTRINVFPEDMTVGEAVEALRRRRLRSAQVLRLVDGDGRLSGVVELRDFVVAAPGTQLSAIAGPVVATISPMEPSEEVVARLEAYNLAELPVVDFDGRLLGVIRHAELIDALKDEATVDIQTMVGASRDERALSPSLFAVRKRMPWLQVNLLTAFLAASVVGIFEDTIAKVTALAILLPVVAGQSGNAGAQALAVTMRALALREIRISHWFAVLRKEVQTGFLNGLSIAATCALGVYIWSGNAGLVLVIALSMVISMVAAGMAGALVPISLARVGQDPAVASSIILTTVTDIVGFFSFLGIATLLGSMLT